MTIIAMVIFAISAFLLGSVLTKSIHAIYTANAQSTADFIAFQEEQQIMADTFSNIQPGTNTTPVPNYLGYNMTVQIVQNSLDSVLYDAVTITVNYPNPGSHSLGTRQLEFYRCGFA